MAIYHIAHRADWDAAVATGTYTVSTRGATLEDVGFIHASHAHQVRNVAQLVYAGDQAELCVVVIDPEAVRATGTRVVDEDGGDGDLYPHLYGPIDPAVVSHVRTAAFDASGTFRF